MATFHLTCLEEGEQPNVTAVVAAEPNACSPQSCSECYTDQDQEDICGTTVIEPELIAPGHTTHLSEGQYYVVTARLKNYTEETLTDLFARIYAKQAESDDSDTPDPLAFDPSPVESGTQDGGQDFDADGDGWIKNGSPSVSGLPLPPGWPDDRGLTSAGPDDGFGDDEGTGDNAWPWIDTWDAAGGDKWMNIKGLVDAGTLVPDCLDTINGVPSAANNYSNDFCSFNHIRLTGDEPYVKQLDPFPAGQEQTVAWAIQCIGDGDVDVRVYFWDEEHEGLMIPATQELDSPCHDGLPDPADRDDWLTGYESGDRIWWTESVMIQQDPRYILTMSKSGSGTVTPGVGYHDYSYSQVVDLIAVPEDGWEFAGWIGSGTPAIANPGSPNTTITMNGDYSITANFALDEWSCLDYDANSNGKIEYVEMIDALMDYLTSGISYSQMIDVLMCYLIS